ncbi:MAG: ABC transporter ATP-binding protein [Pseudomonadota bacterium]|nr:ABC transporter ATP-binding protein [Pseudomonadota bacterium]
MIDINNLSFKYHKHEQTRIINNISFKVNKGELVSLLGPSGCGKTSTLRLIAGLETPNSGSIFIEDVCVSNENTFVEPHKRGIGFLFQDFALFPHLTTKENIAWGLHNLKYENKLLRVAELLKQISMEEHKNKYPHELSGGEQQRVSLARALAPKPSLLLLDEPFSSLDSNLRHEIREETSQILREANTTAIIVTHDPEEAMLISDKIILMNDGEILQEGTAHEIYCNPSNQFVATFLSYTNQVDGLVRGDVVETILGNFPNQNFPNNTKLKLIIRPEAISISKRSKKTKKTQNAIIDSINFLGTNNHIWFSPDNTNGEKSQILAIQEDEGNLQKDDKIQYQINKKNIFMFKRNS